VDTLLPELKDTKNVFGWEIGLPISTHDLKYCPNRTELIDKMCEVELPLDVIRKTAKVPDLVFGFSPEGSSIISERVGKPLQVYFYTRMYMKGCEHYEASDA
jgi:hypothetical protein